MDRRPENPPEDAALTKAEKFNGGCLLWARADGRDPITKQLVDSSEDGMIQSTPTTLPYLRGQVAMLNGQREGGCNYHSEPQGWGQPGGLRHRVLEMINRTQDP